MLISTISHTVAAGYVRRTYEVTSLTTAFGFWLADRCCRDGRLCLIDPPTRLWNIGVPGLTRHVSLGALIWHLGQWAHGLDDGSLDRTGQRLVSLEVIDDQQAVELGWDPAWTSALDDRLS